MEGSLPQTLNSDAYGERPNAPLQRSNTYDLSDMSGEVRQTEGPVTALGPYELAVKERMMGIYLAVYVHRDVKALIRGKTICLCELAYQSDASPTLIGTDQGSVTAGLIGGRVGNKGGGSSFVCFIPEYSALTICLAVGVSLDVDGTTFLFINAHLAAHQDKSHARMENLAKIKVR